MATPTIRRLDEKSKAKLRIRAAHNGRSVEQEAREILRSALLLEDQRGASLYDAIRKRMEPQGGEAQPAQTRHSSVSFAVCIC
ncbi:MAG TPA: hypothetical protein VE998_10200 [Terriglobales bacterium]|nr:hypothetical protein [Terriglobales bacterium]